jgi:protein-L-isoaspartate(D-aspartate) O-methyltransferase
VAESHSLTGKDVAVPAGHRRSPADLARVLRAEGIRNRRVLAAFREVPRARFLPSAAADQAYLDEPIRIPHRQVTTQPSLIAKMVAALGLNGSERVQEVGTGLGFQTAILARLARHVVSIERFADLAEQARTYLAAAGPGDVTLVVGDGTLGVPDHAPYQAIVVSAASPSVPAPLIEQLAPRGPARPSGRAGWPRAGHRLPRGSRPAGG